MPPDVINNESVPKPRQETFKCITDLVARIRAYSNEAGFFIHIQKAQG